MIAQLPAAEFILPITLADGVSTEVRVFSAAGKSPPVCICLPAMGVRAEYYDKLGQQLASCGITAVTCDLRGHGKSSVRAGRNCDYGYHEILNIDLPGIINGVKSRLDCEQLLLLGHSLGGHFGLLYAARAQDVRGVIMIASGTNWYKTLARFYRRWGRYIGIKSIGLVNSLLGYFPGDKFGFGGREFQKLIQDWHHESLTGKFRVLGSELDYESLIANCKLPVFFMMLRGDKYAPESNCRYLAAKLKSADVEHIVLSPDELGLKKACHFRWAKRPEIVARQIQNWQRMFASGSHSR